MYVEGTGPGIRVWVGFFLAHVLGPPRSHLFSMLPVLGGGSRNYRNEPTQEGSSSSASQASGSTIPDAMSPAEQPA